MVIESRRPTGPEQLRTAPALWQQDLDRQVQHLSDETVDYSIQEARAASKTVKVSGRMSETTGRRSPRPTVDRYHEAQACRRNT